MSTSKPQPNRPKWRTPRHARRKAATPEYLDRQPSGTVLEVRADFGNGDSVPLSVVKVSPRKWGVHTRRGFPASHLVGTKVIRRVRRNCPETGQSDSRHGGGDGVTAATDSPEDDDVSPAPDASRLRRIQRPQRGRSTWTTLPEWRALGAEELDTMPVGASRSVRFVPGVYVALAKEAEGWRLLSRSRIPSEALAGLRSAPRVLMDPEAEAE